MDGYLRHIGDVDHLLAGRHVADDADVQRVDDLTLRRHQALLKLCVFVHVKQPATTRQDMVDTSGYGGIIVHTSCFRWTASD